MIAQPVFGPEYELASSPREDSFQKDGESGADLLFLTNAKSKDTHLYFHQRSWLADASLILFDSSRPQGGLMGYVIETGELVRITAKRNWWHASGSPDGRWVAADNWHGDIMLFDGKTSRPQLLTTGHRTYGWRRASRGGLGPQRRACDF